MVKFIESELVSLKKEVNEMWTLVYNQLDRAGEAVLTFNRDQAQQVIVREKRVNAFELKIDSDVEDTIALYNPVAIDLRFVRSLSLIHIYLLQLYYKRITDKEKPDLITIFPQEQIQSTLAGEYYP